MIEGMSLKGCIFRWFRRITNTKGENIYMSTARTQQIVAELTNLAVFIADHSSSIEEGDSDHILYEIYELKRLTECFAQAS